MNISVRGNQTDAGAVAFGGHNNAAPANFKIGSVGFGPHWHDEDDVVQLTPKGWKTISDSMAASIIRLEQENQELRAANAVAEQERAILVREMEGLREVIAWHRANS